MNQDSRWTEMMVKVQKGDGPTYTLLLQEISKYLLAYLTFKLRSTSDAQDVLQEVLISVHKSRHTFDASYPFKPWLFTICHSRVVEFWRKYHRRLEKDVVVEWQGADQLVAEAEISSLDIDHLQQVLNRLPDQQKQIMTALKLQGKSVRQLSVELDMTESAVKVAAHRAYKAVAQELGVEL